MGSRRSTAMTFGIMSLEKTPLPKSSSSIVSEISRPWRNQIRIIHRYWSIYGGIRALATSPYLQLSVVIGLLSAGFGHKTPNIAEISRSIVPSILGLSISGMAILLAFASSTIIKYLTAKGDKSFFMRMSSVFVHFIIIQVLCLLFGLLSSLFSDYVPLKIMTAILTVYAILSAFSVGIQLFQAATIVNKATKSP